MKGEKNSIKSIALPLYAEYFACQQVEWKS